MQNSGTPPTFNIYEPTTGENSSTFLKCLTSLLTLVKGSWEFLSVEHFKILHTFIYIIFSPQVFNRIKWVCFFCLLNNSVMIGDKICC